jgi:hypothetical protein
VFYSQLSEEVEKVMEGKEKDVVVVVLVEMVVGAAAVRFSKAVRLSNHKVTQPSTILTYIRNKTTTIRNSHLLPPWPVPLW